MSTHRLAWLGLYLATVAAAIGIAGLIVGWGHWTSVGIYAVCAVSGLCSAIALGSVIWQRWPGGLR